ncbi:MAG: NAD-glutamate dehydrogenase [Rickettsiales bacterium]|nr:NAD-glutamate dehydrogenase [Rickettsiales bacterium]
MVEDYKEHFANLIQAILSHLPDDASDLLRQFVMDYYAKMPIMNLETMDPERACRFAQNSFGFFQKKTSHLHMRIFYPEQEEHGWKDGHMVLEIHNDDMSFILDSLTNELARQGFEFYETIHPVIYVKRDKSGELKKLASVNEDGSLPGDASVESFIHFKLSHLPKGKSEQELMDELEQVLYAVQMVNEGWRPMAVKAQEVSKQLDQVTKYFDSDEVKECQDFLNWLCDRNYVFLGSVDYDFYDDKGNECLDIVDESELGLFRLQDDDLKPKGLSELPPEVLKFAREPRIIDITKSHRKSMVHRPVLMDYISVKRFDEGGKVIGETRFIGMFTSTVYYQSAERIPFIRRKIHQMIAQANYDPNSHNAKQLKAILEFYPRDELFQISEDELFDVCIGLMSLNAKPAVRLFVRKERYERFVSCMIFIPRERFNTYLRERISSILEKAYHGKSAALYTNMGDAPLARVHLLLSTTPGEVPDVNPRDIEQDIARITNEWADTLRDQLVKQHGEDKGRRLYSAYCDAFPEAYIQMHDSKDAVSDIAKMEEAKANDGFAVELFKKKKETADTFHLKMYIGKQGYALSDLIPILERLGCRVMEVHPFDIATNDADGELTIRDFRLQVTEQQASQLEEVAGKFQLTIQKIWGGDIDNDAFNALVIKAGLAWREILVLRAYCQYMRQVRFQYSRSYIAEALGKHPEITRHLVGAFLARFDPEAKDTPEEHYEAINQSLDKVSNLAEDRIIRYFMSLIQATLRTNFFQTNQDGSLKSYLSFKLRSSNIPGLPKPVPYAEIFVYSRKTEGVHLRGGEIARGGLRWSDRPEDFRTEVLGLMKAQMVKNSVIVPQGSKGCFISKHASQFEDRDAFFAAGVESYKEFLSGLLDLTDNIKDDKIVPPVGVKRYDGDDPYLVVAADKGTATFSDIANGVALDYGFWLGDAFASGGSAGYDHKAMGITAKGAWVSVTRHFLEMGLDVNKDDFTVVGIGDMSGDVFGNGMLLSEHIKLVAAFNHRNIFLDPNPDPAKSFIERKRLFETPRSTWQDYDKSLISKGGGIFGRDLKSVPLSAEIKAMLEIEDNELPPEKLIQAIMKMKANLLWNGGIGTYIKASDESHEEVGDPSNNNLRINGEECRFDVIGEGGNLGVTQKGRIEYARTGGRCNTDAIDNSAGVDCSDHEVNIKITFSRAMESGALTLDARNTLLESMTDEVSDLVLIDNRLQTQALTVAERQGFSQLETQARMMRQFEQEGLLNREVEFLPSEKQLNELRIRKVGLTRPELSVLLSYSKLVLFSELRDSAMVEEDYFISDLIRYFPKAMQSDYRDAILSHRLRKDIVATIVTNSLVNRAGITFASSIMEGSGFHPCDIARGYVISRDAFKLRDLWSSIESLDGIVDANIQAEMFVEISHFLERVTLWFLHNIQAPLNIEEGMQAYAEGIDIFRSQYQSLMSRTLRRAYDSMVEHFTKEHVPQELAENIAGLEVLSSACDVVSVANEYGFSVDIVGQVYFEIGAHLRLGWLRRCAHQSVTEGYWDRLAVKSIMREFYIQQRRLTARIIESFCKDNQCSASIEAWVDEHKKDIERYEHFINELKAQESVDMSMLVVALRNVEGISSV